MTRPGLCREWALLRKVLALGVSGMVQLGIVGRLSTLLPHGRVEWGRTNGEARKEAMREDGDCNL